MPATGVKMHVVLARPAGLSKGMMKADDSYVILGTIPDVGDLEEISNKNLKLRIQHRALKVILQPLKEANLRLCTMTNVRGLRITVRPIIAGLSSCGVSARRATPVSPF